VAATTWSTRIPHRPKRDSRDNCGPIGGVLRNSGDQRGLYRSSTASSIRTVVDGGSDSGAVGMSSTPDDRDIGGRPEALMAHPCQHGEGDLIVVRADGGDSRI